MPEINLIDEVALAAPHLSKNSVSWCACRLQSLREKGLSILSMSPLGVNLVGHGALRYMSWEELDARP